MTATMTPAVVPAEPPDSPEVVFSPPRVLREASVVLSGFPVVVVSDGTGCGTGDIVGEIGGGAVVVVVVVGVGVVVVVGIGEGVGEGVKAGQRKLLNENQVYT